MADKRVYHVLKCQKNHVCELLDVFASEEEAYKFCQGQDQEMRDNNAFVCVYQLNLQG